MWMKGAESKDPDTFSVAMQLRGILSIHVLRKCPDATLTPDAFQGSFDSGPLATLAEPPLRMTGLDSVVERNFLYGYRN
jgi:hypothetical protein